MDVHYDVKTLAHRVVRARGKSSTLHSKNSFKFLVHRAHTPLKLGVVFFFLKKKKLAGALKLASLGVTSETNYRSCC